jgi:homoserine trans-succinylase
LVEYNFEVLKKIEAFDLAITADEEIKILLQLQELVQKFGSFRQEFEKVYSQTRILNKPENYILDQDHHNHPANQSVNFDWQFISEILFLEKVNTHFKTKIAWQEGTNPVLK